MRAGQWAKFHSDHKRHEMTKGKSYKILKHRVSGCGDELVTVVNDKGDTIEYFASRFGIPKKCGPTTHTKDKVLLLC